MVADREVTVGVMVSDVDLMVRDAEEGLTRRVFAEPLPQTVVRDQLEESAMTPATDWKEDISPGENERFEGYAERFRQMQRGAAGTGAVSRALHAKGLLGLDAEFAVLPDLPEHARVGLFAEPRTFRAYVRFSNGAGAHQPDTKGDVRGVAVKLLGVDGKKVIPGLEDAPTQDFLMIRDRATPFHNADEFANFILAMASPLKGLPRFIRRFGFKRTLAIVKKGAAGLGRPTISLATTAYDSAAPIRFGVAAVHYGLRPQLPAEPGAKPGTSPNYLAEELITRLGRGPVVYDFGVQFFVDETRTPIEDASVEWTFEVAPFVPLARLTLPAQDPTSERGRRLAAFVETLSFDTWHAQVELRPLGSLMRARNVAYRVSTKERGAAPEPDGTERFD